MTILHLVEGILSNGDKTWLRQGAAHFADCPAVRVREENYFAGVFVAKFLHHYRCLRMSDKFDKWRHEPQIIAAHSYGCKVTLDALKLVPWVGIERLVLIAGAGSSDCEVNGLNLMAHTNRVKEVIVLHSPNDRALWFNDLTNWLSDRPLGLHGPVNVSPELAARMRVIKTDGGHSDYFNAANFRSTMDLIYPKE